MLPAAFYYSIYCFLKNMNVEKYIDINLKNVHGQTIIITGANSGIGFLISKTLVKLGGHIVMACRNLKKAEQAKHDIVNAFHDAKIDIIHLDQDDFDSCKRFIDEVIAKYPNFDGMIFNAGILKAEPQEKSKQGFYKVVSDNFLSVFYMMHLLKPFLDESSKKRKIIFQGSLMSSKIRYKQGDLMKINSRGLKSYSLSKTGIENLFYELAKNNSNHNVSYLLAEPGACRTNIYHNLPHWMIIPADIFMRVAFHTALKGSLTALNLMCNDNSNGSVLVPRGPGRFSGFPKKINIPKKVLKNALIIDDAKNILNSFLTD